MEIINKLVNSEAYLQEIRQNDVIVCYGAGSKGAQTIEILRENNIFPVAFCDNNEKYDKERLFFCDLPVFSYKQLKEQYQKYCILITCTINNALEIYQMLQNEKEKNPVYFLSNPFKAENKLLSHKEIIAEAQNLQKTFDLLSDAESKQLYINFLNWKITGDQSLTLKADSNGWLEWFDEELLPDDEYTYVDAGAYTGDTILRFLVFCRGKYKKILAYEPDEINYFAIKKMLDYGRMETEKIEINRLGLWSEKGEKVFYSLGASDTTYESSNFFRSVKKTVSNQVVANNTSSNESTIMVDTLDNLITQEDNYLIKIDTLASEFPIIQGAKKLIQKYQPKLILEFGTHSSHIADMVPFLSELNPNYKFYLRQKRVFDNSRTVLYVV